MKELMKKLNETGYYATIETINKNGIDKKGLVMKENENDDIGIVFYDVTIEDYDSIIEDYKKSMNEKNQIKESLFSAVKDIEHTAMLCIRPKKDDDVLTWDVLDLQMYVRINVGDGTFVVTKSNFEQLNIFKDELLEIASRNSRNSLRIKGLGQMLFREDDDDNPTKVMMCNNSYYGAVAMLFAEDVLNEDCYILPSSIHEVIVLPVEEGFDIQELRDMVYEINRAEVNEIDRLSDNVYLYRADTRSVEIVK